MNRAPDSLAANLRAATADLHARAERHPFVARLFGGGASRASYADYLGELAWIHGALEEALRGRAEACGLGSLPEHAGDLALDLRHFGRESRGRAPREATRRLCGAIEAAAASDPVTLAGFVYVLEGSMNGARMLADRVRRSLELPAGEGTAYLDPYGELQPSVWKDVRQRLDALVVGSHQARAIESNAAATFESMAALFDALEADAAARAAAPAGRA